MCAPSVSNGSMVHFYNLLGPTIKLENKNYKPIVFSIPICYTNLREIKHANVILCNISLYYNPEFVNLAYLLFLYLMV